MSCDRPLVFAGSASKRLGESVCQDLGIEPAAAEVLRFPEGNVLVRLLENVRGRSAYVIQSTAFGSSDQVMELLFWMDALKRASAASVTAVIPYFSYGKGDKMDEPRVSIRARVVADALQAAGADRVLTMDLHARQIQGFFAIPVDDLQAMPTLAEAISAEGLADPVVVSPDLGFVKKGRAFAARLNSQLVVADKRRSGRLGETVDVVQLIGDVAGRDAVLVDDFTLTMSTLAEVAEAVKSAGARRVMAAVTHGVFAEGSMGSLERSPIDKLLVTDTVENQPVSLSPKVEVVPVGHLFAEAIRREEENLSLSELSLAPLGAAR
ncbi:MAG TPA: ribose-phosphate diphosphokinase [Streptosporangiaceae bacterium]|nr:ribose-phosphate diphosphokinase [Streptosporangiaceae bacterium]HVD01249.1 ribose-phosphate diphosphokinase [Candidatus Dormibacteraeota bacterium]